MTFESYLVKCRTEAERQWCYADLPEDHIERTRQAFELNQSAEEFITWLGEKYDLIPKNSW